MQTLNQQFLKDNQGNNIGVFLPIKDYNNILEELDELECIKAYDKAKTEDDEVIPFREAFKDLDNG